MNRAKVPFWQLFFTYFISGIFKAMAFGYMSPYFLFMTIISLIMKLLVIALVVTLSIAIFQLVQNNISAGQGASGSNEQSSASNSTQSSLTQQNVTLNEGPYENSQDDLQNESSK